MKVWHPILQDIATLFHVPDFSRANRLRALKTALLFGLLWIGLYAIGHFLPVGFDWQHFFGRGSYPPFWMPWTRLVMMPFNLPAVFATTLLAIGIRAYRYRVAPLAIALALLSLPTLWVLFTGNVDGLVMLGLLILPWGAPLVLIKPQIAAFALLARWRSLFVAGVFVLLSFAIWGLWPLNMGVVFTPAWRAEWQQDITLFPWGLMIALPLLWFSRGDEDLLMAAGSLCTPHLFPYHFIVLMPALARLKPVWMILTWLISWAPIFIANRFGTQYWHVANLLSLCFWFGIRFGSHPAARPPEKVNPS